jgi:hypothetical protein
VTMTVTDETAETIDPSALPEGVFHLLAADNDVTTRYRGYMTLCGELLVASGLPLSCWSEEGSGRDPRYCPDCVREAGRWSVEAGVYGA